MTGRSHAGPVREFLLLTVEVAMECSVPEAQELIKDDCTQLQVLCSRGGDPRVSEWLKLLYKYFDSMVALTERSHLNNSFSEVKQLLNALSLAFQSPDSETASPAIDLFTKMMSKYEPDLH
jgi:hypothetical protein